MKASKGGLLATFMGNAEPIKYRISKSGAYLGVISSAILFGLSLFFSWSQIKAVYSASDTGSSSGWADAGWACGIPLLYIWFCVLRTRRISPRLVLYLGAVSVALIYNNVLHRSTWVFRPTFDQMINDHATTENHGSDLGAGFWAGFVAIVATTIFGVTWAFHNDDELKRVGGDTV